MITVIERPKTASPTSMRTITVVLGFACGASVANLYYAQPLLALQARSFHVSEGAATAVVTATQLGYALGLALLLPLGDLLENRRLASRTLFVTAAALVGAALAPTFGLFLGLSVLVGITSVVAQMLVPLAAHLAPPAERGRFVGRVVSGLLLGILLARTIASLAAAAWGWRSIYLISAVLMVITSVAVTRVLPTRKPDQQASYGHLLRSLGELVRTEPALRTRALCHACMFGAFTAYWTTIAYELAGAHHLSQTGIAVFALVGAAGAAIAPIAGRLGDRGYGVAGRAASMLIGVGALAIAGFGARSLVLLALGGVLLDLAVQGHGVLSQRDIYALRGDARARITTVFMTTVFIGGAISSAASGALHSAYGWRGASIFAAILPLIALALWLAERARVRRIA
jgi:predicted MFS family arabinose efflux permease